MTFKRLLSTQSAAVHRHRWPPVKQVTKPNFSQALSELKSSLSDSDFVAFSLKKTGGHSAAWQKILPIDTVETAYAKAKRAAENFQILQFAVCPFKINASSNKLVAHPYNFQLFPRDELRIGMPCYSFACQPSYLTAMTHERFDFNTCIYEGISYLSKAQESTTKLQSGHLFPIRWDLQSLSTSSSSGRSVADSLFVERIKSRVRNWITGCKNSNKNEDALISSLRNLISGSEVYGSRPSLSIDVCSERQVELVLVMLKDFVDIVPLRVSSKGTGVQAVRVVLTSSEEDKNIFEKQLIDMEEEKRHRVRGFQEVIDIISTSERPVVAHNSLNDFAFIHSKFLAPLPSTVDEYMSSLHSVFPNIIDINHLMKEIGPFDKIHSMPAIVSHLERNFSAKIDMDISNTEEADETDIHGRDVLSVCRAFVKLCSVLKISLVIPEGMNKLPPMLQRHVNIFSSFPCNPTNPRDDDIKILKGNSKKVSTNNLVFLWGFGSGISARKLKDLLLDSHDVLSSQDFDVRMVDRTCAAVAFWSPGFAEQFLEAMEPGETFSSSGFSSCKLKDLISQGLKSSGYKIYKQACESRLWKQDLAECLDQESEAFVRVESETDQSVIDWDNEETINLDEL